MSKPSKQEAMFLLVTQGPRPIVATSQHVFPWLLRPEKWTPHTALKVLSQKQHISLPFTFLWPKPVTQPYFKVGGEVQLPRAWKEESWKCLVNSGKPLLTSREPLTCFQPLWSCPFPRMKHKCTHTVGSHLQLALFAQQDICETHPWCCLLR